MKKKSSNAGYTLFEISMVVAIVGLLTGLVMMGQMVYNRALLQKQIQQIAAIDAGVQNYITKYQCLAGDCTADGGNGNGYLEATWANAENNAFWSRLSASGMIEDRLFTHPVGAVTTSVPRMALNNVGVINAYGNVTYAQNILHLATGDVSGALTFNQIYYLDGKMDDGVAASGSVRSSGYGTGVTTVYTAAPTFPLAVSNNSGSTQCVAAGVYSASATTLYCNMVYIIGSY